jgi:hypothetical protein
MVGGSGCKERAGVKFWRVQRWWRHFRFPARQNFYAPGKTSPGSTIGRHDRGPDRPAWNHCLTLAVVMHGVLAAARRFDARGGGPRLGFCDALIVVERLAFLGGRERVL